MAGRNWQAGSKISLATALMCLLASAFPPAHALAASGGFAPSSYVGSVATHLDCTEQRKLSRKLSSTTQFLESVLDNVPVCVAAKNIEDGRYIFANRAFERFSRFSRDHIIGKTAEEIFSPATAAAIVKA